MVYGDIGGPRRRKNKANSKPNVFFTAEHAEFAEQKRIFVQIFKEIVSKSKILDYSR